MTSDLELLQDYARNKSEESFAALVNRHLNLVYSAASRQVRSPQLAEEVAQAVFMDLSQSAATLRPDTILTAWLYQVTRRSATDVVRRESRRQLREQIVTEMNTMTAAASDWTSIEPLLDEAMQELDDADRAAVLLRYFENKSLREVGAALGSSDDAAQKRVSRAVERLREFFAKRGVKAGAAGLAVVISANAVQAAPAGLAFSITAAALLAGTAVHTSTVITATKAIAMTTLQKTAFTAAIAAAVGAGIFEAHQASTFRTQVETLRRQQAPLAEQLAQLRTENEGLSNQLLQAKDSQALSKTQLSELLKLRGQAGMAGSDSRELAKLKSTLDRQTGTLPDYMTNAMVMGLATAEKFQLKEAQARLARMKKILHLTDDQAQAIADILQNHIHSQSQIARELMSNNRAAEILQATGGDSIKQEAEIKALFTPEQLSAYPEYQQAEKLAIADDSAKGDAGRIADDFNLSKEQQEQIRAAFCQIYLSEPAGGPHLETIAAAHKNGNPEDALKMGFDWGIEMQKVKLEEKLRILQSILTPEQLSSYREEQMNQINMSAMAMKMFIPQKTFGTPN